MRILQINVVCGVGSTGRIVVDLYKIIQKKGHDCLIAYGRGTAPEKIASVSTSSKIDMYHHAIMTRLTDRHAFFSTNATINMVKKIKEYAPDVIHLHTMHGYHLNIEILFNFLKEYNKPIVWTQHDCWSFTGHCAYFDFIKCDKWRTQCFDCPSKSSYPKSCFVDNSLDNFKKKKELFCGIKNMTLVTPSKWLAELTRQSFLKEYSIKVINNGIDLNLFKPTTSDFVCRNNLENKFIVLGVADIWDKRKGLDFFLTLSRRLNDDYKVILVGLSGSQKKQLPANILGITRTESTKELAELYTIADVFVNPTLEEVLGMTNLEALACGAPVITFATGGSVETIDETCGIVVEKGNIDKLIKAIQILKQDNFSQEACLKRANLFDKDIKFKEYLGVYGID